MFVPLHRLLPGPAPEGSCGLQVAQLAGLPRQLISRAHAAAGQLLQQVQRRQEHTKVSNAQYEEGAAGSQEAANSGPLSEAEAALLRAQVLWARQQCRRVCKVPRIL